MSALYKCDSCKEYRDEPVCLKCGADTRKIDPDNATLEDVAAAIARNKAVAEAKPAKHPTASRPAPVFTLQPESEIEEDTIIRPPSENVVPLHPVRSAQRGQETEEQPVASNQEPATANRQPPTANQVPQDSDIVGLEEFHGLLDRGMKAIIVCGDGKTGKSEIAAGFTRANSVYRGRAQFLTLRAPLRTDYVLSSTNPDEVWYQIIDDKRTFLDPSGEFFKRLSPDYRQKFGLPDITDDDFRFVQRAVKALAGIILVFDLTRTVDMRDHAAWRQQENDFNFILPALRWLRFDKEARSPDIRLSTEIAQRAKALPLIDQPVLVLFSKADQLTKISNQSPFEFAKRRLPILHSALMTHTHRFRYDFCHTMQRKDGQDRAVDHPCGVLLPVEWLLDDPFRWLRRFSLPTRRLGGGK